MSILINSQQAAASPTPVALASETTPTTGPNQQVVSPKRVHHDQPLSKALNKTHHGHDHDEKHIGKKFKHLSHAMEKMFGEARKVDHAEGEEELKKGGLRRVAKELGSLFKGLGIPNQLAKQFARGITSAIKQGDVDQVDLSMTSARTMSLNVQNVQSAYLKGADGAEVVSSTSDSLQLSSIKIDAIDISLNLRTGDFSYSRTQFEGFSLNTTSTFGLAANFPPTEAPPALDSTIPEADPALTSPAGDSVPAAETEPAQPDPGAATDLSLVWTDSSLLQISRMVQTSAVMQLKPQSTDAQKEVELEDKQQSAYDQMDSLFTRMDKLGTEIQHLFEPQVQIHNLRVEKDTDEDEHLRFTLEALVPVGISVVDEENYPSTLFPLEDGTMARLDKEPVNLTV